MDPKVILSLFDYSGNWPAPYKEAGYTVYQVDIKHGIDILEITPDDIPSTNIYGILAAVPCTDFASSGARWWAGKDADGSTEHSLKLLDKTLELIKFYNPKFWVIENPVGRIAKLRPEIGKPWYFNPNEFAGYLEDGSSEQYTKKTGLFGKFNKPIKKSLPPVLGSKMHTMYGGKSERTKELRSMTPLGFAKAFFEANP